MTDNDGKTVTVSTTVPAYQRDEWREDAEAMGMSLAEFVRCMVQAGRRGFDLSAPAVTASGLQGEVVAALDELDGLTWGEMVAALPPGASADDLEAALERLQQSGDVIVRAGGRYDLAEE